MGALPQRARGKDATRARVRSQRICLRGKMERGTQRDPRWTATSEEQVLHKNVSSLARKNSEREAQMAHWPQEVRWEGVLTKKKNMGRRSRKNCSPIFMENRHGQSERAGRTGHSPCLRDGGLDQALDQADTLVRNAVPYTLKAVISPEAMTQSTHYAAYELLGSQTAALQLTQGYRGLCLCAPPSKLSSSLLHGSCWQELSSSTLLPSWLLLSHLCSGRSSTQPWPCNNAACLPAGPGQPNTTWD